MALTLHLAGASELSWLCHTVAQQKDGATGGCGGSAHAQRPGALTCYHATQLKYFLVRRMVLTPHVAGVTELSYRRMAQIVAAEARRMRDGLAPSIVLNSAALRSEAQACTARHLPN